MDKSNKVYVRKMTQETSKFTSENQRKNKIKMINKYKQKKQQKFHRVKLQRNPLLKYTTKKNKIDLKTLGLPTLDQTLTGKRKEHSHSESDHKSQFVIGSGEGYDFEVIL